MITMAKKPNTNKPKVTYTTSGGVVLRFGKIPTYQADEVRRSVKMPEQPTFTIMTALGIEEVHKMTRDNYENPKDAAETATNLYKLEEYEAALLDAQERQRNNIMNLFLAKGVDVDDVPPLDSEWAEEQAFLGITVPKGKLARKVLWLKTDVLVDDDDIVNVLDRIMDMTGMSKERVAEAKASFRRAVEEAENAGDSGEGDS